MAFPSENSVDTAPVVAYQGQIHAGSPRFVRACVAEGASVIAGIPVKRGTDPELQVLPFTTTDLNPTAGTFAGVVVLETSRPYSSLAIEAGDPVAVMELGRASMTFAAAVTAGQGVKIKHADNTLEGVTIGADAGAGYSVLPGLRIAETTAAAGLAKVDVNLYGLAGNAGTSEGCPIRVANIPVGPVARASIGTDAVSVAGTIYFADLDLAHPMVATGLAMLNGTTGVGTDLQIFALWDEAGNLLRTTALAGTTPATADVFQEIAFTSPISLPAGKYWIGFQLNGTTSPHQTIAASTYLNSTGSVAGVFATIPAITPTTTTTAGVGPIGYLYT